jgi:hypothetical protein
MSNPKTAKGQPPRAEPEQQRRGKILNSINAIDEARGGDGTARSIRETLLFGIDVRFVVRASGDSERL